MTDAEAQRLRAALTRSAVALAGAASAYRKYASCHGSVTLRATSDPFFLTRADDFERAAKDARDALKGEE